MKRVRRLFLFVLLGPVVLFGAHLALFRVFPVPLTPLMLIRWNQDQSIDQSWVELEEISPHLARSVIASEDNRFCVHQGVDWTAVKTVMNEYRSEGRLRGASTISMQTVKNLYLWPGRSVVRKALETGMVHVLERAWTKERIMEVYLNIIEFGPGIYGAQSAAQHHFGIDASELSFVQAASLAAILPDPLHRDPTRRNKAMGMRVQNIRNAIHGLGDLLHCVPTPAEPPTNSTRRVVETQTTDVPTQLALDEAPLHFQPVDTKSQHQTAPQEPRRGKQQKIRTKRRRSP